MPAPRSSPTRLTLSRLTLSRWLHLGVAAVLASGVLLSCSALSSDDPPLSEEAFQHVLIELHLWSARAELQDSVSNARRDSIFEAAGTTEDDFQATLRYYTQRPERLEAIYDRTLHSLQALRGRLRERSLPGGTEESGRP